MPDNTVPSSDSVGNARHGEADKERQSSRADLENEHGHVNDVEGELSDAAENVQQDSGVRGRS